MRLSHCAWPASSPSRSLLAESPRPRRGRVFHLLVVGLEDTAGFKYLLASFHGDTNGLASLPVLNAIHSLAQATAMMAIHVVMGDGSGPW